MKGTRFSDASLAAFRRAVRTHYKKHRREFPWRETRDPYRILVSEVMLQQTQVSRAQAKYAAFLKSFPTLAALAAASPAEVLRAWQGLGYNRRALSLHRLARKVAADHGGEIPADEAALLALPGVGQSTAGAVLAFACGRAVPFVETNIRRAYLHHFYPRKSGVPDADIRRLVAATLDRRDPRNWYYALMDYGAMLGRTVPNPNLRSAAYKKQGAFEGSDRRIRGLILRALAEGPKTETQLARLAADPKRRTRSILRALAREGFVSFRDGCVILGT